MQPRDAELGRLLTPKMHGEFWSRHDWDLAVQAGAKTSGMPYSGRMDFAPTILSLAGVPIPAYVQGAAFLGSQAGAPRDYVYGARDRVDEAFDVARSVRDARYLYIRNYLPHLSWHQPEAFSDTAELRREIDAAKGEGT